MAERLGLEDEQKKAIFKDMLTQGFKSRELPDEIFLLSGGIIKRRSSSDEYKSLSYKNEDVHGRVTGGKARVFAAAELGKALPELNFVTTSKIEPDAPSHAAVMQAELIHKGINPDHIMLEEKSVSTSSELVEMVKLAVDNNWSRLVIMSNDYHLPRVQAMLKNLETIITYDDPEFRQAMTEFKARNIEVSFLSAEGILCTANPRYESLIEKVHQSEAFQKTLESEAQGLKDLEEGRYKVYNKPPI